MKHKKGNRLFFLNRIIILALSIIAVTILITSFLLPLSSADLTPNTWNTRASMPTARGDLGVAVVAGKIFAIGGANGTGVNEMYDSSTNIWVEKKPMPTSRLQFAITVYESKIYCIGGIASNLTGINEVYDPATDSWQTKTSMPQMMSNVRANTVGDRIYIVGGKYNFAYDPDSDSWQALNAPPVPVGAYASAVINNRIYVIGGYSSTGLSSLNQIYNTETGTWSNGTAPPTGGYFVGAATSGTRASEKIFVMGGGYAGFPLNLNLVYDPVNDSWNTAIKLTTAKNGFGIGVIDDIMYLVGGWNYMTQLSSVDQYVPLGYNSTNQPTGSPSLLPTPSTSPLSPSTTQSPAVPELPIYILAPIIGAVTIIIWYSKKRATNKTAI